MVYSKWPVLLCYFCRAANCPCNLSGILISLIASHPARQSRIASGEQGHFVGAEIAARDPPAFGRWPDHSPIGIQAVLFDRSVYRYARNAELFGGFADRVIALMGRMLHKREKIPESLGPGKGASKQGSDSF